MLRNVKLSPYFEMDSGEKNYYPHIVKFDIKGRDDIDNNYFEGKHLTGRIEFSLEYPTTPPKIIFDFLTNGAPLQMLNLYTDGVVCHNSVN